MKRKQLKLILIATTLLSLVGCGNDQSEKEKVIAQNESVKYIESAPALPVDFDQVSAVFLLGSDFTDLQRDTLENEIIGKIVQWSIPIYEISRREDGTYAVTTNANYAGKSHLTASVFITARNTTEQEYLTLLKSGDVISFKGKLSAFNFRLGVTVSPAVLTNVIPMKKVRSTAPIKTKEFVASDSSTFKWTQIGGSNELSVSTFLDKSSIRKVENIARMWRMDSYNNKSDTDYNFTSSVYISEFNCQSEQTRVVSDNYYTGAMGTGMPVRVDNKPTPWVPVAPATVGSTVMKIACGEN